jgi:hypothetical protein
MSAPFALLAYKPEAPRPVEIGGEELRDEDARGPVGDFVSAGAESPVEACRDPYDDAATAGFSSLVLAVDEVLATLGDAARAFSRRSIRLRALPVSSIALLICGATILAAVLALGVILPLLILSATGSFSTIVGIDDAVGFDETADFQEVEGFEGVAGFDGVDGRDGTGNGALFSTTVDCVDIGLALGVLANPALPS